MLLTAKHPLLILSNEFAELCKPIELFSITHVTYQKIFKDGSRISLSNKPQWVQEYYNLKLYQTSLFENPRVQYPEEFNVWLGDYDLKVYQHGKLYYKTTLSISISEPTNDGCEFYLFATAAEHARAIHYLANNREILYHFISYIRDRGKSLLATSVQNRVYFSAAIVMKNNLQMAVPDKSYPQKMERLKKEFFKNTPLYQYTFMNSNNSKEHITQRELQCIAFLLDHKTASETAKLMNISRRTVESYLDNIKIKFNCSNKTELINKLKDDHFLSAIH